jgi:hypothetical protein
MRSVPSIAASAQTAAASSGVWNDSHASTNTTSNETHVGEMHVHTPATDGADFAQRFGDWTRNSQKFAAANFGGN